MGFFDLFLSKTPEGDTKKTQVDENAIKSAENTVDNIASNGNSGNSNKTQPEVEKTEVKQSWLKSMFGFSGGKKRKSKRKSSKNKKKKKDTRKKKRSFRKNKK